MRWKENHQDSSESPHPMGKTGLGLPEPILDKLYDHNLVLPPELGLTQNELCQAIMDGVLPKGFESLDQLQAIIEQATIR